MKLRLIFLVLSLLAFLSAATGGYLYYASLKTAAFKEAQHQAIVRVEVIQKNLSTFLAENVRPVRTLAGMRPLAEYLARKEGAALGQVNLLLDNFKNALQVDVCYLMNYDGVTVASSNRGEPDSFVSENFAFRPYFQGAVDGFPTTYLALGTTSGKRGVYCSYPVFAELDDRPLGVVVIKTSLEEIEKKLGQSRDEIVVVVDPHGLIFIASQREWLFQLLWQPSERDQRGLVDSRQFGPGPWSWTGLVRDGEHYARDKVGKRYFVNQLEIDGFPGWQVVHLRSLQAIYKVVLDPLVRVTVPTVITLCFLVAFAVFFLYRKASVEIVQRKKAESALRESEERYRSIYHNTPAMLHSINLSGCLVSVSDHWLEVLGYTRNEVVGAPLVDFLTPASRVYAREEVLPEFFRTGSCKDISYQYVRKDGTVMDVLLSAIGDRDPDGVIVRSLAVSIDISARKAAEEALQQAQAKLSLYARDLEDQVKKRTADLQRLSGRIMAGQEKERAAIARGLHDELGQVLTALRLETVWLAERMAPLDGKASARAAMMSSLIDETIDEVRSIALRLRPGILDDLGLLAALEWSAADFERRVGIICAFKAEGEIPDLSNVLATAAYRITQEALTNVVRHAGADQVTMSLLFADSWLSVTVEDDGCGFRPERLSGAAGLGVAGMRERAALIGGTLEIFSQPGRGTRVVFRAPFIWDDKA
ncbi:MAG: PAS domain S-box protein [Deltaproteobacteria bacterium]|nr:PAS domain S-box protein [Deltaproteobacteria bacterium]